MKKKHSIQDDDFKGKVVLVTGANRGFGLAVTMDLARAGASVIMLARDLASLEYAYDAVVEAGLTFLLLHL
mgnify:CR=1 FL=1